MLRWFHRLAPATHGKPLVIFFTDSLMFDLIFSEFRLKIRSTVELSVTENTSDLSRVALEALLPVYDVQSSNVYVEGHILYTDQLIIYSLLQLQTGLVTFSDCKIKGFHLAMATTYVLPLNGWSEVGFGLIQRLLKANKQMAISLKWLDLSNSRGLRIREVYTTKGIPNINHCTTNRHAHCGTKA